MVICSSQTRVHLFILLTAGCLMRLAAQDVTLPASPSGQTSQPPLKDLGNGLFQIGEVRLDKNKKAISFTGWINLTNVVIEYGLVAAGGKLHESLLATSAQPYHIHLAALLVGITNRIASVESGQPLTGAPIQISVSWQKNGKEHKARLEDWIRKQPLGQPMDRGIWLYNGSRVVQGIFMAQAGESIISIIEDVDALINNPRKGREDDTVWFPNEKEVPPADTRVTITIEPAAEIRAPATPADKQ